MGALGTKYQQYEAYKESGVEWLGEIPSHWEVSKFRYMFSFSRGLTITKADLLDVGVPCVNYGEVHSKYGFEIDPKKHYLKCVDEEYLKSSPYALLNKGDLVFADTSEDIEGSGNFTQLISNDLTFAGYHTVIARPFDRKCSRFYAYLMDCKEIRTQIRHMVKGVKVFSITQSILKGVEIWLPSLSERETIANFLDHETTKIDTLIDKQQTLIQLLKEKRQAVISHTVTKGLNPDAPMKDSGVEWLGSVPEHWEIMPLKYAVTFQRGHDLPAQNRTAGNVPLVTSAGISSTHDVAIAKAPGLVTGRYGTIGKFNLLEKDYWPLNTTLYSINLRGNNPKYLWYMLHNLTPIFLANSLKSAVPGVDRNDLHVVKVVIPKDLDEQAALCDYLEKTHCTYDLVIKKASESLILLQERRTALISAAVTGKIDVRGWAAPDGNAE